MAYIFTYRYVFKFEVYEWVLFLNKLFYFDGTYYL